MHIHRFNQPTNQPNEVQIQTKDGSYLEEVDDFKYLGSRMKSSENDIRIRKAMAWKACNKLDNLEIKIGKRHQGKSLSGYCGKCPALRM